MEVVPIDQHLATPDTATTEADAFALGPVVTGIPNAVREASMTSMRTPTGPAFHLEYPMSLGVFDDYVSAQRVVDRLSDQGFPVSNIAVVGTELKSFERVTGRMTRGRAAIAGAASGLWIGLFVGIAFSLFSDQGQLGFLITTPLLGALFMLVWTQIGYRVATQGGARDFSSVSQIIATKYEVLVEHRVVDRARTLLSTTSGSSS